LRSKLVCEQKKKKSGETALSPSTFISLSLSRFLSVCLSCSPEDFEALCRSGKLRATIAESLDALAKEAGLKGFECVKKIHVVHEPFSVENDLVRYWCTALLARSALSRWHWLALTLLHAGARWCTLSRCRCCTL
jgi:hypothetical protein